MMLRDVTLVKGFAWDLKEHMFKVCLCSDDLFLVFIFVDLQEKAAFIFCVKDRGSSLRRLRWGNPCRLILALLITRGSWPLESESLWAPLAAVKKWNSLLFRLLYGLDEFFRYSDLEWSNKVRSGFAKSMCTKTFYSWHEYVHHLFCFSSRSS